ncbi:hypothetical protein QBK99_08145 [Corticibacterium sp. UT-5YL-CI-8]|nr:hypothetical protein [Tianweitania sp. UT-5YL-CI-8]
MMEFRRNDPLFIDPKTIKALAIRNGETFVLSEKWHSVYGSPEDAMARIPIRRPVRFAGPLCDDCGSQFWIAAKRVSSVVAVFGEPPTDLWGNELPPKLERVDVTFDDGATISLAGDPTEIKKALK